jgi:hypothetical protein
LVGELVGAGAGDEEDLAICTHQFLNCERGARASAIGDRLHPIIKPFAGKGRSDIRLVLMVGLQDLDRLAVDLAAELFGGHSRRFDRAGPHGGGEHAVHVGEHADADSLTLDLGLRRRACDNESY